MSRSPRHSLLRSFYHLIVIGLLALACRHPSYQSSPSRSDYNSTPTPNSTIASNRTLPSAFRGIPPSSGSGEVLYGGMTGTSASGALWGALNALAPYFDAKPNVLGAAMTTDDSQIQALLDGTRDGHAIRGIGYAQSTGSQCLVAVVYDGAEEFARTSGDLIRVAQQSFPAPSATPVPLQHTTLADGTTLDLPGGWTVQPNNGSVGGNGPQGGFDFGLATQVYTPEAAAYYAQPYGARAPLVAAYGDPGRELQELWAQMKVVGTPDDVHIIERTPLSWWTSGPAEMLHVQAQVNGNQTEWVAEVLTSSTGADKWMYYYSGVSSSQATFNQNLPVLLRIWQSWKTDDRVFQERLMNAAQSLRECGRIISEANAFRQDAMERSSMAWDHYVRGTWPIEDQQTHARYISEQDVNAVVRQLNESEGQARWRVVPYDQLNR